MPLLDRLPFRKKETPPPATIETRATFLLETLIDRFNLRRARAFLNDLQATEALWPVVLPLLAWIGWRTYSAERRKVQARNLIEPHL